LKRSLWYGVTDIGRALLPQRGGRSHGVLRNDEFWAMDDISFELRRGECLGLVGRNGAGKTTLLKLINGLIKPDAGRIEMRGRVGALIALGAGFNPILTGRENIYVNGSVLGLRRKEIDERIEEIIDFADIRDFIDAPVQSYSSGMQVRLGFAVATALEPDILLLDEVLAVGDFEFQRKCLSRIEGLIARGVAVIFVSHNLPAVSGLCDKGVLLDHGRLARFGPIDDVIHHHLVAKPGNAPVSARRATARNSGEVLLKSVGVQDAAGRSQAEFRTGNSCTVRIEFEAKQPIRRAIFGYGIYNADDVLCSANRTVYDDIFIDIPAGEGSYEFQIAGLELHTGRYRLAIVVFDERLLLPYAYDPEAAFFTVRSPWLEDDSTSPVTLPRTVWRAKVDAAAVPSRSIT
jgi:lipopolysaccharide transport system ATP-binding protein